MIKDTKECAVKLFEEMFSQFEVYDATPDPAVEYVWLVIGMRNKPRRKTMGEMLAAVVYIKAGDAEATCAIDVLERYEDKFRTAVKWYDTKKTVNDLFECDFC
jgi:hypothetical protein